MIAAYFGLFVLGDSWFVYVVFWVYLIAFVCVMRFVIMPLVGRCLRLVGIFVCC